MPELPEVETVRRGMTATLSGSMVTRVEIHNSSLRWPIPATFADALVGTTMTGFRRLGKYILCDLSNGRTMLIHLGMSGSIRIVPSPDLPDALLKHDHVVWHLDSGRSATFNDPRRFGMLDVIITGEEQSSPHLRNLGPEPLGNAFNREELAVRLAGRRVAIKNALLDQRVVAGIGNIYACESLWMAGIAPTSPCGQLDADQLERLVAAIRSVLRNAITAGGSTLRNYRNLGGEIGGFQDRFQVYDQVSRPCPSPGCDGTIERITQSARSTFFCPRCQSPGLGEES